MGGEWLTGLICLYAPFTLLPNSANCVVMKRMTTHLPLIIPYVIVEERCCLLGFGVELMLRARRRHVIGASPRLCAEIY